MFRLLLVALIVALAFYYAMVALHYLNRPTFDKTPLSKLIIPFYGWVYLFNNKTNNKNESKKSC